MTRSEQIAETASRLPKVAFKLGDIRDEDLAFLRQMKRSIDHGEDAIVRLFAIRCLFLREKRSSSARRQLGAKVESLTARQLLKEIEAILERP